MSKNNKYAQGFLLAGVFMLCASVFAKETPPNVIMILADDLGYGDVHCLNPEHGKIATPRIDALATQGMVFTDAHSSSSVCTPTRYGILTGRYNWRSKLQRSVLWGFSQPLIATDRLTVAGFLKGQGYNTAAIGKWHLGLALRTPDGKPTSGRKAPSDGVDWTSPIADTPVHHGFDYFYGIAASLDMPPYIFIENDHFVGQATATKEFYPNRQGPAEPGFEAVDVLPTIGRKSVEYIQRQKADKPFFMYIALTSPHTPLVPTNEWETKSGLGPYGGFVMQTDATVGQIVDAVDAAGFGDNTLIVVTSDNGCSKAADNAGGKNGGLAFFEKQGHYPSAQFRGSKSDLWDGGHRVPFIVRWPAGVKAGSSCNQTICLTDLMATSAELTGAKLPATAGEDSVSFAPALNGQPIVSTRKGVIHHSINGKFAYRQGKWKLLLTNGSGGWTKGDPSDNAPVQLYDMDVDPGEQHNLYASHPEVVERLRAQLTSDVKRGRSNAGPDQQNDVDVRIIKGPRKATNKK